MRERKLHLLPMGHIYENLGFSAKDPLVETLHSTKASLLRKLRSSILSKKNSGFPLKIYRSLITFMYEDSPGQGARELGIPRTTHIDRVRKGIKLLRRDVVIKELWREYTEIEQEEDGIMSFYMNLESRSLQVLIKGNDGMQVDYFNTQG